MSDMPWFRSPHRNGKWHVTRTVARDGVSVEVYIAKCGTMIGVGAEGVPMRDVAPPDATICSKCLRRRAS